MEIQISLVKELQAQILVEEGKRMSYWKKICKSKIILMLNWLISRLMYSCVVLTSSCVAKYGTWTLSDQATEQDLPLAKTSENCNDPMDV